MHIIQPMQIQRVEFNQSHWELRRNQGVPEIRCYADAKRHWDETAPTKGRDDKPMGLRSASNRKMIMYGGGSIGFSYYGDEVIVYHPDGTIDAMACQQQRNRDPSHQIYPKGLFWGIATRTGPVLYSAPQDQHTHYWQTTRVENEDGKRVINPDVLVMRANKPIRLQLIKERRRWEAVDPNQPDLMEWQKPDHKASKRVSAEAGMVDFVAALDAYIKLGVKLPDYKAGATLAMQLQMLRERDFLGLMAALERGTRFTWNRVTQQREWEDLGIKKGAINKLRTYLYEQTEGVMEQHSARILNLVDFTNVETQLKRFGDPRYSR